jgi:hypothetical protein
MQATLGVFRVARIILAAAGGSELHPWVQTAADAALGSAWLYLHLRYLPYSHQRLNQLQCALAGVYLTATVSVCAELLARTSAESRGDGGVVLFVCAAPIAAFAAWTGAAVRVPACLFSYSFETNARFYFRCASTLLNTSQFSSRHGRWKSNRASC